MNKKEKGNEKKGKERIHVKNHLENHFPATLGSSPLLAVLLPSVHPHL